MHHGEHAPIQPHDFDHGSAPEATSGRRWPGRLLWLGLGALLGAAASYLADPDRGDARRAELAQQATARGRELQERAIDTGRDLAQRTVGSVIEAVPEVGGPDDAVLLERVRSEAMGRGDLDTSKVVTNVRDGGVVEVRGQLESDVDRRQLLSSMADVDGVREVVDLTHLPHEPAPTRS